MLFFGDSQGESSTCGIIRLWRKHLVVIYREERGESIECSGHIKQQVEDLITPTTWGCESPNTMNIVPYWTAFLILNRRKVFEDHSFHNSRNTRQTLFFKFFTYNRCLRIWSGSNFLYLFELERCSPRCFMYSLDLRD